MARHRAAAGVQHTGKGVGDLIWLRVTKLEAEESNAWLVYTSKYLSGSEATQGGRLKSQAENHKREKHNFMQTHTVMKDKDLLREEALQQMGGKGWKLWRELLLEGTTASSGHDYTGDSGMVLSVRPRLEGKGYQRISEELAEALVDGVEDRKN